MHINTFIVHYLLQVQLKYLRAILVSEWERLNLIGWRLTVVVDLCACVCVSVFVCGWLVGDLMF